MMVSIKIIINDAVHSTTFGVFTIIDQIHIEIPLLREVK
jgi:hypothetical protein